MNNKKLTALIKASNQLSNAWLEIYQASSKEMDGNFFEIRNAIGSLETRMIHMIEQMKEDQDNEE